MRWGRGGARMRHAGLAEQVAGAALRLVSARGAAPSSTPSPPRARATAAPLLWRDDGLRSLLFTEWRELGRRQAGPGPARGYSAVGPPDGVVRRVVVR